MEYKEGAQYDIAECESQEAGPTAATLKWQVLDKNDRVLSDSSIFSACKDDSKDDSNFCGKTNGTLRKKKFSLRNFSRKKFRFAIFPEKTFASQFFLSDIWSPALTSF